jgi:uncharacterized protein
MRRKQLESLKQWWRDKDRKPIILRGARQVGKSTLVRLFAKAHDLNLIEINLEKVTIKSFEQEDIDIENIVKEISYKTKQNFDDNSLLFIDEIQESPRALQALRYFYEEKNEIAVIAAGSLLEFSLHQHNFSLPVGRVEYMHLGPMTFIEFLWAQGQETLASDMLTNLEGTIDIAFDLLKKSLREFYFVGGMPEAVKAHSEGRNWQAISKIHQSIMETYIDDFGKYATSTQSVHLGHLLKTLPFHIGKKIKFSELLSNVQHPQIKRAVELLEQAKIISKCYHSNASGIPLSSQIDESVFKIYFLDIGLLNFLMGLRADHILELSAEGLLTEGIMAEQFIAQHLKYMLIQDSQPLLYWLKDKKKNNAEIDFLIQKGKNIIPIEVKAGKSGTLKSLIYFMGDKKLKEAIRFDMKQRNELNEKIETSFFDQKLKKVSIQLKNYPLFAVEILEKLLLPK